MTTVNRILLDRRNLMKMSEVSCGKASNSSPILNNSVLMMLLINVEEERIPYFHIFFSLARFCDKIDRTDVAEMRN